MINDIEGVFLRYTIPSFNSTNIFLTCFTGKYAGNFIFNSDMITGRKLKAFIPKHIPSPNFSKISPARAGPIIREKLTIEEFSASALGKSSLLSTIS